MRLPKLLIITMLAGMLCGCSAPQTQESKSILEQIQEKEKEDRPDVATPSDAQKKIMQDTLVESLTGKYGIRYKIKEENFSKDYGKQFYLLESEDEEKTIVASYDLVDNKIRDNVAMNIVYPYLDKEVENAIKGSYEDYYYGIDAGCMEGTFEYDWDENSDVKEIMIKEFVNTTVVLYVGVQDGTFDVLSEIQRLSTMLQAILATNTNLNIEVHYLSYTNLERIQGGYLSYEEALNLDYAYYSEWLTPEDGFGTPDIVVLQNNQTPSKS